MKNLLLTVLALLTASAAVAGSYSNVVKTETTTNSVSEGELGYSLMGNREAEDSLLSPEPVIVFEPTDMGVEITVDGEGLVYVEVIINDLQYDVFDINSEAPGATSWFISREFLSPKHIVVTATAQLYGYLPSTVSAEYFLDEYPQMESPAPVIGYEVLTDDVVVWANSTGERPPIGEEGEWIDPTWLEDYPLFLNGEQVQNPYWVPRPESGEGDLILEFSAFYQALNAVPSEWTYLTLVIPPKEVFFLFDDVYYCITGPNEVKVAINDWSGYYTGQVVVPETVTCEGETYTVVGIRDYAFAVSGGLTDVTLPSTITSIGESAFIDCMDLTTIICHATVPPSIVADCFVCTYDPEHDTYAQAKLFVPNEAVEAYRAHEEWGRFTHIVPFNGAGPGDINGDGSISVSDMTSVISMLLSAGDDIPAYCDVNGDGNISVGDVTALINQMLNAR